MASPILQFKRGNFSNLPGLQAGEPALTVDKFDLYVGIDSTTGANKLIGSHRYWTRETTTAGSGVNLVEGSNNGSNKLTLKAPGSVTSDVTYTLPGAAVNHGFLKSDASGNLSWDSGAGIQAGVVPLSSVDIDGATATTTVADADLMVIDDGANGTNRKVTATVLKDYFLGGGAGANFNSINVSGITTSGQTDATTLKVSGISTFTGIVDINGAIDADGGANIAGGETVLSSATVSDLTDNRVVIAGTSGALEDSGNLTFDGSTLGLTGALTASGTVTANGAFVANGNVDLGNATSDTITPTGRFDAALVPATDGAVDLGTSDLEYKDLYIDGTAHIDTLDVDINATVAGTLGVTGETTLASAIVSDLTDNRVVIAGTSGALEDSGNLTFDGSTLGVTGAATVSGNATVGGNLDINGSAHDIAGQLTLANPPRNSDGGVIAQVGAIKNTGHAGLVTAFKFSGSGVDTYTVSGGVADIALTGIAATTFATSQTTTATQGQTAVTVSAGYTNGFIEVFHNGVKLISGNDFTETDGNTVTLAAPGATVGDTIETIAWKSLGNVVNIATLTTAGDLKVTGIATVTGLLDANGGAAIDNIQIGVTGDNEIDTASGNLTIDSAGGTTTIDDHVVVSGNLTVNGTTTTINSTTVAIDDKNFQVATGAADDAAANGAGLTVDSGDGDKTWNFEATGDNWGSSENINLASGKVLKHNNTSILSSTTLGSSVVNSSLTTLGTIATGVWNGTAINDTYVGTIDNANKVQLSALDLDGGTDIGADIVDADLMIVDDGAGGTNRKTAASRVKKYIWSSASGDATASDSGAITLAASGVTAATVGSSTAIPILTIDAKGRITNTSTTAIDQTTIAQANTNIAVSDSGTGTAVVTIDGSTHSTFAAAGLTLATGSFNGSLAGATAGTLPLAAVDIDGATASTTVVDADLFVFDDGANGTNRKITATNMKNYFLGGGAGANFTAINVSGITTAGQLDATTVKVSGISTFTGAIDANGGANVAGGFVANSAAISDLTDNRVVIAGTSGELEDSGNLTFDGSTLTVTGAVTASGTLTANGNVDLGNATSDTITATGRFDSDIVPSTDGARDLGTSSLEFKDLYLDGTANIDALVADSAKISDLTSGRVVLAGTSGEVEDSGNLTFNGSTLAVTGNITSNNGATLTGAETTMSSATVSDLTDNRVVIAGSAGALEDSNNLTFDGSTLAVTGAATVSSNLTVSGNLTVNGTTSQINTVNTTIEDVLLELQVVDGSAPSSDTNKDVGVIMNYYSGSAKKAAMYWDDSSSRFVFSAVATESAGVLTNSTAGALEVGSLYVNDCAGNTQLVSCSGTTRSLENISIDGGTF